MIRKRVMRTGDGSHEKYGKEVDLTENLHKFIEEFEFKEEEKSIWGWDDKDINLQDKSNAKIYNAQQTKDSST